MKKTMILLLAAFLLLNTAACTKRPGNDPSGNTGGAPTVRPDIQPDDGPLTEPDWNPEEGEPLYFEQIQMISDNMTAERDVIEVTKTPDGVDLVRYFSSTYWDDENGGSAEQKRISREIHADEALYEEIAAMAGKYGVADWDGFHESAEDVLDGEGFSFHAVLTDGGTIDAHGSNAFPDGFFAFRNELQQILTEGVLEDTVYRSEGFTLTLPESWVDEVHLSYSLYGEVRFYLPVEGNRLPLLDVCTDEYYYWASEEGRTGRLVPEEGETVYLSIFTWDETVENGFYQGAKLTDAQMEICSSRETDLEEITGSLQEVDGYTFYPEDGSTLYQEDARSLFEDARSIWLNLALGGEYASGTTKATIDGREYRTFSASYDSPKITTVEACREKLQTVFTEEYTDRLVTQMVKDRDLVEYQGNLYVPMNKIQDHGRYAGYWVDHVDQDGDTAELYLNVRKAGPNDELYTYSEVETIAFPMEKEEDGIWRFSDYPYWDK